MDAVFLVRHLIRGNDMGVVEKVLSRHLNINKNKVKGIQLKDS